MSVHFAYNQERENLTLKQETFEDVYSRELDHLVKVATFMLGTQSLAEEAVHDGFIKLHNNWFEVNNPGGFVRTAVVNRCKDLMRRNNVSNKKMRILKNSVPSSDENHYLIDALAKLEPKRRAIVVLKYYGSYTIREIAEMLALAEGTVRSNLNRGLAELKGELK